MEILSEVLCVSIPEPNSFQIEREAGDVGPREEVTTEQVGRPLKSAYTEGIAVASADYLAPYSLCAHFSFGRQKKVLDTLPHSVWC